MRLISEKKLLLGVEDKGVWFFGKEKRVWVIRSWKRKEGFFLLSIFLHPISKRESALFFLLVSVFPTWFFTAEILMRSMRF